MKARYKGDAPVILSSGAILRPGDIIEIADHEARRPDFEVIKEGGTGDDAISEIGLHRTGEAAD